MPSSLEKGLTQQVEIGAIVPNLRQPRTVFAEQPLKELAASIAEFGILQPLLVRALDANSYELIAGERRLRAAKIAGLATVPILICSAGAQVSLEIALIENVQREDINGIECARAYRRLIDEFGMTQEQVADRVGKSRTTITNTLRLLRLPVKIQQALSLGQLSEGHAKALLSLGSEFEQLQAFDKILTKGLSVREVEKLSRKPGGETVTTRAQKSTNPDFLKFEQRLAEKLGAPVEIGGGELAIRYFSEEDLERILLALGVGGLA